MSNTAYVGQDFWKYNCNNDYRLQYPQQGIEFARDLGALIIITNNTLAEFLKHSEEPPTTGFTKPFKPCPKFVAAVHESMKCKLVTTPNKISAFASAAQAAEESEPTTKQQPSLLN